MKFLQFLFAAAKRLGRAFKKFFERVVKSAKLMTKQERISALVLLVILITLISIKGNQIYLKNTVEVPAYGGIYRGLIIGDVKYLSPVLASTDAERSISRLIYSGLVKLDPSGQIVPDLTDSYTVSEDGTTYDFLFKEGIQFQNGQPLTSADVAATINAIKDPSNKSPYFDAWSSVTVTTPAEGEIVFTLPHPYGPFIYSCLIGIMSSGDVSSSLINNTNGTGPYKLSSIKNIDKNYRQIALVTNGNYFGETPFITNLNFENYTDQKDQNFVNKDGNFTGVAGVDMNSDDYVNLSYETSREVILIPNLKKPFLVDANNRKKLFSFEKFDNKTTLSIVVLDTPTLHDKANELINNAKDKNIDFNFQFLSPADYQDKVTKHDYDLLLYAWDAGYDRDLYVFWHSSQISKNNFAGYSDKNSDIFLEDARMVLDPVDRNKRYDQFWQGLKDQSLVYEFAKIKFNFNILPVVKGVSAILGVRPEDRFSGISSWYINSKRVRKIAS